jgi:hypothetical protein
VYFYVMALLLYMPDPLTDGICTKIERTPEGVKWRRYIPTTECRP